MASPDFSQYVDLTLFDEQPATIYEDALAYARLAVPELDIVDGSIEDALLQAFALMTGYSAGAINRLPNGTAEIVFQLLGITRNSGTAATGSASFTFTNSQVYEVPLGTRLAYTDTSDTPPTVYIFQTTETVSASAGVTASIEGVTLQRYPELASEQALRLITPISHISSVELSGDLDIGAGPESDVEYLNRAATTVASFSTGLVTASQFTNYVLARYPSAYRAKAYSRVDAETSTLIADPLVNGHLTVFVSGLDGASFSAELKTEIEDDLTEKAVAGLEIHVVDPTLVSFDLTIDVALTVGAVPSVVKAAIVDAVNRYLHPDYWDWSGTVRYNELIALISNVSGVDYVDDLTIVTSDAATEVVNDWVFDNYGTLPQNTLATTDITVVS